MIYLSQVSAATGGYI